ncbi:MAG: YeeE/YedE thiosulfate transporter family protein [Halothiobacillus sp.]
MDLNQTKTSYRTPDFAWGQYILGGLIFGVGMVLARGCPVRSLVKFTQGNMQALVAVIVMALSAYAMTRTELFSVAFAPWVGMLSVNLTHWGIAHQDLASILGGGTLTYRIMAVVIAAGLLFAAWRWLPLRKNWVAGSARY